MAIEFRIRVSTVLLGVGIPVWGISLLNQSGFPDIWARLGMFGVLLLIFAFAAAFTTGPRARRPAAMARDPAVRDRDGPGRSVPGAGTALSRPEGGQ